VGGYLRSLLCLENEEFVFPSVHHAFRFALLTLAGSTSSKAASLVFFARQPHQVHDARRRFRLTPEEFQLINPNTRTCPIFRSERDAELTKKLHRAAPVLIEEEVTDANGNVLRSERNPWDIRFTQGLFNMTSDSGLFRDAPAAPGEPNRLPLYEAKMIHQFDHRWATYVDAQGAAAEEVETADVSTEQKVDPSFEARPRYWVDEREVLARIARVPSRVAKAWLALHAAGTPQQIDTALADLLLALAAWVAGELFNRAAGEAPAPGGWSQAQALPHLASIEAQLKARFFILREALRADGLTTKKALVEFPKWASQILEARLSDDEVAQLHQALEANSVAPAVRELLDGWMDRRC
jgi:hypothetical protein